MLRGKYVLENLLASPPPPPPPNVPSLKTEGANSGEQLSLREAMVRHRANPACASCHARMDPIGFAMENFDAVGQWRDQDAGKPIDVSSTLPDGTVVDGVEGVKKLILKDPAEIRRRGDRQAADVRHRPQRAVLRCAGRAEDRPRCRRRATIRSTSLVLGVVQSAPFQMRTVSLTSERMKGRTHDVHHQEDTASPNDVEEVWGPRWRCRCWIRWSRRSRPRPPPAPRLGFVYVSHGVIFDQWKPTKVGQGFELTPNLKPLEKLKGQFNILTGLSHLEADTKGDGTGDHTRASAAWLTGVHAYDRTRPGVEVKLATTADQIAAQVIGKNSQIPSIEMTRRYRLARLLRFRRLLLRQHGFLAQCDHAQHAGESSARDLRTAVRRRRHQRPAAGAHQERRAAFWIR